MPDDIYTQEYVVDVVTEGAEQTKKEIQDVEKQLDDFQKQINQVKDDLSKPFHVPIWENGIQVDGPAVIEVSESIDIAGDSAETARIRFEGINDTIREMGLGFQEVVNKVHDSTNTFESMSTVIGALENDLKLLNGIEGATAEQQELINELIEHYSNLLQEANNILWELPNETRAVATATDEVTTATDQATTALEDASGEVQGETVPAFQALKKALEDIKTATVGVGSDIKKTFTNNLKSLKRFALGILGIRSAYSAFRKVMSTAMANSTELATKFNAIWQALANALTPFLTKFIDTILKAFAYLNIFIKALSGGKVDLLASTSKGASSTAKSLAEANKQLAGFDELSNIDENTGSGIGNTSGVGGWEDAFSGLDINTEWADKIQHFGEWVRDNWILVTGALLGTVTAIELIKNGVAGWTTVGVVSIIVGAFTAIQGIADVIEGIKTDNLDLVADGLTKISIGIGIISVGLMALGATSAGTIGVIIALVAGMASFVVGHWDEIKTAFNNCVEGMKSAWEAFKTKVSEIATAIWSWITDKWNGIATYFGEKIAKMRDDFSNLRDKIKTIATDLKNGVVERWNNIKNAFITVKDNIVIAWEALKTKIADVATKVKGVIQGIKDDFKDKVNSIIGFVEGAINKMISGINSLIRGINKIRFTTPDWIPLIGGKSFGFNLGQINSVILPRLDTGTNYVPSDQLAMVHKGEAVIPKRFNSQEYFGNSEETNTLLQTLIDKVDSLELNPYITVKDVGEASAKYQNQQYRLRGRALVNG